MTLRVGKWATLGGTTDVRAPNFMNQGILRSQPINWQYKMFRVFLCLGQPLYNVTQLCCVSVVPYRTETVQCGRLANWPLVKYGQGNSGHSMKARPHAVMPIGHGHPVPVGCCTAHGVSNLFLHVPAVLVGMPPLSRMIAVTGRDRGGPTAGGMWGDWTNGVTV